MIEKGPLPVSQPPISRDNESKYEENEKDVNRCNQFEQL